jgi:uncharacterized tellurite resistance protein B-like protein
VIERLRALFGGSDRTDSGTADDRLRLATAALMVEVMLTDGVLSPAETARIPQLLARRFALSPRDAAELVALARREVAEATSLYQFTALVNRHFGEDEKYRLVCSLWEVAYADTILDKYEEGLIRQVAELIHLPHSRYIQARNQVRDGRREEP